MRIPAGYWLTSGFCALLAASLSGMQAQGTRAERPWVRHTIDGSSRGADGVRLADVNGDGLLDLCTGWEEGGVIRVYLHPGHDRVGNPWPAVTVGQVASPEDAVFADLDGDGAADVISSCEGKTRSVFVHWAPRDPDRYLDRGAWKTEAFPALQGRAQWMYALPLQVDGRHGPDLVLGAKGPGAQVGWLEAPANPRALAEWKWHPLCAAGWIMSLEAADMDGDGDLDILATDRKGPDRGCFWLENPGMDRAAGPWRRHLVGGQEDEVMFLDRADLEKKGSMDLLVACRQGGILRLSRQGKGWHSTRIAPAANTGGPKSVRAGDIDLDGRIDLVYSCEGAAGGRSGLVWLSYRQSPDESEWVRHELSGADGIKHDLVQLLDLDGDGDLDALTCEETVNLGVIWYENPTRTSRRPGGGVFPRNTWETRTPEQAGLSRAKLEELAGLVGGRGCVVRHGYMVHGWGDQAQSGDLASAVKPVISTLLLFAVQEGKLSSVDDPVAAVDPRLRSLNGGKDAAITWRHLASQTSGYGLAEPPGQAYAYNDYALALYYDALMEKVFRQPGTEVLKNRLGDPLQFEDRYAFRETGPNARGGRLSLSCRDLARFGLFYLHGGQWDGRQLLRKDLVQLAVSSPIAAELPRTSGRDADMLPNQRSLGGGKNITPAGPGFYSFNWWLNRTDARGRRLYVDAPADTFVAAGHGGKRMLWVIPSLDLIVAWNDSPLDDHDASPGNADTRCNRAARLMVEAVLSP